MKTYTLEIKQDEDGIDPRSNDNIGKMICFHGRYNLGDKHSLIYDKAKQEVRKKVTKLIQTENKRKIK